MNNPEGSEDSMVASSSSSTGTSSNDRGHDESSSNSSSAQADADITSLFPQLDFESTRPFLVRNVFSMLDCLTNPQFEITAPSDFLGYGSDRFNSIPQDKRVLNPAAQCTSKNGLVIRFCPRTYKALYVENTADVFIRNAPLPSRRLVKVNAKLAAKVASATRAAVAPEQAAEAASRLRAQRRAQRSAKGRQVIAEAVLRVASSLGLVADSASPEEAEAAIASRWSNVRRSVSVRSVLQIPKDDEDEEENEDDMEDEEEDEALPSRQLQSRSRSRAAMKQRDAEADEEEEEYDADEEVNNAALGVVPRSSPRSEEDYYDGKAGSGSTGRAGGRRGSRATSPAPVTTPTPAAAASPASASSTGGSGRGGRRAAASSRSISPSLSGHDGSSGADDSAMR